MSIEEAKQYIKATTLYGNENAPIGSSARSYFECELRCFLAGYNRGVDDSVGVYMRSCDYTTDKEIKGLEEVLKLKIK